MDVLKVSDNRPEILKMLRRLELSDFIATYSSLARLLARLRHSSSHRQLVFETPPQQTTVPEDPNHSGGSKLSSSSTESKPEPFAQNVATDFLNATYNTVVEWMTHLRWVNPAPKLFLDSQY